MKYININCFIQRFITNAKRGGRYLIRKLLPNHRPGFLIVGAQKAGTSSLHFYLNQHPQLVGARDKEIRYFDRDENFIKGNDWYLNALKDIRRPFVKGIFYESTPEYLYRSYAAKRIYEFDSNLKIIVILRDPLKRAYSSWNMYRDFTVSRPCLPEVFYSGYIDDRDNNIMKELYQSNQFPSFKKVVSMEMQKIKKKSTLEEPSFLRRGIYLPQIKRYHNFFGREKVLILGFKDLIKHKKETLNKILKFLNIEHSDWKFINEEKKNARTYPKKMSEEMEHKLTNFYEPYNKELFEYLEKKINW